MNKWVIGAGGSVFGFVVSQWIAMHQFSQNLAATKEIETIHLARELTREFYSEKEGEAIYRQVRNAIEACGKVYESNGGHFDHDQVNRYLGFFDDLGYYYERKALDLETINQIFGAYIIEAYEYEELRKYVADLQRNSNQHKAFSNFQALGQALAARPDRVELVAGFSSACRVRRKGAGGG
jgi:hypothetical protein